MKKKSNFWVGIQIFSADIKTFNIFRPSLEDQKVFSSFLVFQNKDLFLLLSKTEFFREKKPTYHETQKKLAEKSMFFTIKK